MSGFVLKIIAIISMLFDHIGYAVFKKFTFMNYIGRIAFPIFAFGIAEGYYHTKNVNKYFLRLFIFAIISQIPYMLFLNTLTQEFYLNILFTFALSLLLLKLYNTFNNKYIRILFLIIFMLVSYFFHFEYDWLGISTVFIFYIFKDKKIFMNISFATLLFIKYFYKYATTLKIQYIFIMLSSLLSLIVINSYNGKKGKNTKYLLYLFYPLQFILLYIVSITLK